jgi:hypothetical protein
LAPPATYSARGFRSRRAEDLGNDPCMFLEPGQLTTAVNQPVSRIQLGRRAMTALWALRVLVFVLGAMVIYTFVSQLGQ